MSSPSSTTTWRGRLGAILIGLVFLAVLAELLLRVVMPNWKDYHSGRFITTATTPGHAPIYIGAPNFNGWFAQNNGDFRVHIALNATGLRNPEPAAAAGGRVWVVGDSMTFGWGVAQNEMYSSVAGVFAGLPTYNIASPGTDVCGYQALLARMPKSLTPKAVVVGLVLENDVSVYDCAGDAKNQNLLGSHVGPIYLNFGQMKIFLTKNLALYNFFTISLKRVELFNRVLISLGLTERPHAFPGSIDPGSIALATRKTAYELGVLRRMLPPGTPFAVLMIPSRFEIRDGKKSERDLRLAVLAALKETDIDTIDLEPDFAAAGFAKVFFIHDGHWNAHGHRIAGEAVAHWLSAYR